ncbi:MAG: ThuA domain-containing protein [Lysobacterales bacterium]
MKIALIAGPVRPNDRAGHHDYAAACALAASLLRRLHDIDPVVVNGGWPQDERLLDGCAAILFYDGGGGKQGFLASPERIQRLQRAVDRGVGLVVIHKSIAFPTTLTDTGTAWLGGTYVPGVSSRGHWKSRHRDFPEHPVTTGLEPWSARDGWLGNIQFTHEMQGVTPLLWSGKKQQGSSQGGIPDIVSWAYERPGGGRSFVFTGLDAHSAWKLAGLRRFLLNGVLWSAHHEIPRSRDWCELAPAEIDGYLTARQRGAGNLLAGLRKLSARAAGLRHRW